ncbi:FG-GAP repeat domain-containing protein [Pelagicoccus mobilis]|uniref:VCBS repeat-containing protein n=1 Tax=Pelagicoccus mobilis TaxID=415221 RepID=A0A934VPL1_9BACT|nr:VCBS repeat-containing protein [Pelagicoccus mobilis]MBK1875930.1 VCBS repeat-containing protein [Pelagicoccus mobilis]
MNAFASQSRIFGTIALGLLTCGTNSLSAENWRKHTIVENAPGRINSAVAADFDGDGHMDVMSVFGHQAVAFKGPDFTPHVVFKLRSGLSRNHPRAACIHSCVMDADGDGDMDFIGSNLTVFWLETPDDPFSGEEWVYRTVDDEILGTHCLITGDVNQDGKIDLIANSFRGDAATSFPNSITWLETPENPHTAKNWIRHVFADRDAPGGNHYMGLGDVNGDGRPDISCGAKGGKGFPGGEWFAWWEHPEDPNTVWKKHLLSDKQPGASNIIPADLNNDGTTDFLASRGHGKGILWFKGPKFNEIEIDPQFEGPHSLVAQDLDGDGHIDAASCGRAEDGKLAWYRNDGHGNFSKETIDENQSSYDLRAIDMDGDGDSDLLNAGHESKNIVWYENLMK